MYSGKDPTTGPSGRCVLEPSRLAVYTQRYSFHFDITTGHYILCLTDDMRAERTISAS